jgi:hypothetical protein
MDFRTGQIVESRSGSGKAAKWGRLFLGTQKRLGIALLGTKKPIGRGFSLKWIKVA